MSNRPDYDLVLHVGMPRATSIIGPALQRLQSQLRAHGVAYLTGTQLARLPRAAGWNCDRLTRRKDRAAFVKQVAALARAEQQRAGGLWRRNPVPVVITGDQLLGRGEIGRRDAEQLRPYASEAISHVIEALSARNVQIVIHTHRQDRLLELSYLRRLRAGQHTTILTSFGDMARPVLDYADLAARLRTVPNLCDVVVRPVELADAGVHAFVEDMLSHLGLSETLDLHVLGDLDPYPNVYSPRGAALARAMNPLVHGAESTMLRRFLTDNHAAPNEYGAPDILPSDVRQRILENYAETNRRLFTRYMPDLPPDSYTDEVATFDLGNVLRQPAKHEATVASRLSVAAQERTNRATTALHTAVQRARRLERSRQVG